MITILLPDQIARYWNILGPAIEEALPPIASYKEERMNKVLSSLLSGKSLCWVAHKVKDEQRYLEALCITQIQHDTISMSKSLLIYALYAFAPISDETQFAGLNAIAKYAKSKGCENVIAYTQNERIIELSKLHSGNTVQTLVTFDIDVLIGGV
jgi:hypothetical protein